MHITHPSDASAMTRLSSKGVQPSALSLSISTEGYTDIHEALLGVVSAGHCASLLERVTDFIVPTYVFPPLLKVQASFH
jgi:hypothetical protein